jgi:cation:H+ antiporter
MDGLLIAVGIALLYGGGEALVSGASSLARTFGLSSLVVGLTVVAFGTSSPELAATLTATFQGAPDIAFGNVVGSNIANLGLILGLTALLWPLETHTRFLWREMPFLLLSSAMLPALVAEHTLTRWEGFALLAMLAIFLTYLFHRDRATRELRLIEHGAEPRRRWWLDLLLVAVGIVLLILGAKALVAGAVGVARGLGVSERVIGLTVVAVGTSLPELASSLVAARHREGDIVLGNLVGSNIFNILCILGVTAVAHPFSIHPQGVWTDLAVMLGLSFLTWPILATGLRVDRREGALLLAAYGGYLIYLFH